MEKAAKRRYWASGQRGAIGKGRMSEFFVEKYKDGMNRGYDETELYKNTSKQASFPAKLRHNLEQESIPASLVDFIFLSI